MHDHLSALLKASDIMNQIDLTSIGQRVKQVREQHHETQTQLAKAINVSPQHISNLETFKVNASLQCLLSISTHYSVPLSYFLYGIECTDYEKSIQYQISELLSSCDKDTAQRLVDALIALQPIIDRHNER